MSRAALLLAAAGAQITPPTPGGEGLMVFTVVQTGASYDEGTGFYKVNLDTGEAELDVPFPGTIEHGSAEYGIFLGSFLGANLVEFTWADLATFNPLYTVHQYEGGRLREVIRSDQVNYARRYLRSDGSLYSNGAGGYFRVDPEQGPVVAQNNTTIGPSDTEGTKVHETLPLFAVSVGGEVHVVGVDDDEADEIAFGTPHQVRIPAVAHAADQFDWHPSAPLLALLDGNDDTLYVYEADLTGGEMVLVSTTPIIDILPSGTLVENLFWDGTGQHLHVTRHVAGPAKVYTMAWTGASFVTPPEESEVGRYQMPTANTQLRVGPYTFFTSQFTGQPGKAAVLYGVSEGKISEHQSIPLDEWVGVSPTVRRMSLPAGYQMSPRINDFDIILFSEGAMTLAGVNLQIDGAPDAYHPMFAVNFTG